ncbi:MAG: fertility inhibition FinO-like protein [Armatimonadetes bacterium]|nr:fertility inhibition FinO-like protein [Armatimonadota bacterium]
MPIAAKMEITLKISELPAGAHRVQNDWTEFVVNAEGQEVTVTVRPKMWNKLEQAQAEWPLWVASITGRMGPKTPLGFVLLEPAVQVFERKAREAAPAEALEAAPS